MRNLTTDINSLVHEFQERSVGFKKLEEADRRIKKFRGKLAMISRGEMEASQEEIDKEYHALVTLVDDAYSAFETELKEDRD